jgi:hypothetical protein
MAERWKARAERGWNRGHHHEHGGHGWQHGPGKRKRIMRDMMRGMPPFMGFGWAEWGDDDSKPSTEPKDYV